MDKEEIIAIQEKFDEDCEKMRKMVLAFLESHHNGISGNDWFYLTLLDEEGEAHDVLVTELAKIGGEICFRGDDRYWYNISGPEMYWALEFIKRNLGTAVLP